MNSDSIVEQIRELWKVATPVEQIAATLHLPPSTIRHVIDHGELPEPEPQWIVRALRAAQRGPADAFDHQPTRDAVSDK
jgi:hypothetical protein